MKDKQKKISRRKFLKYSGAAGATILAGSSLTGCMQQGTEIKNPNTIIDQQTGTVPSLDPAWVYDTRGGEILDNVYETLIDYDREKVDQMKPILCKEVPTKENGLISDDNTEYRFPIKEDITFHNGDTLTPEDVEYTFERAIVQDRSGGPVGLLIEPLLNKSGTRSEGEFIVTYDEIDAAVEVDGNEVVFNLAKPFPPFLQVLAGSWASILNKDWAIENGAWDGKASTWKDYNDPDTPPLNEVMNGTGPYEFVEWESGVSVTLKRFEDYWRETAPVKNIVIELVEEFTTRQEALTNGNADIIYTPTQKLEQVQGLDGVDLKGPYPTLQLTSYFFTFDINRQGQSDKVVEADTFSSDSIPKNFFADQDVRKAFAYAFDYESYIDDIFLGYGGVPPSCVPEGVRYVNEDLDPYSYDLDKAEEHLKKAHDGKVWENGFTCEVVYNTGNTQRQVAAQILRDKISQIKEDFTISVRNIKWASFLDAYIAGKLPVFVLGWLSDYPDPHNWVKPYMHSQGTYAGFQGYQKEEVDELINEGINTLDQERRKEIYYQLQEIYREDVPSVSFVQPQEHQVQRSWIDGFYYNPVYPGEYYYSLTKG
ncbi:MAG: ABC-type transport system, periplasmic component [Candidatus Methanohalarchaeum thermophilum]|uniref:ABC-type transport system, periplasmic component n=1 Tax=Methanohalarchaeum thermophilum TaxID=1903181 RepID=A0A1Q6DTT4_METT1|nr:MAG: ABC-type transport system, periplasmic component [Candidatus Methanohalarchaeum thermophilum]